MRSGRNVGALPIIHALLCASAVRAPAKRVPPRRSESCTIPTNPERLLYESYGNPRKDPIRMLSKSYKISTNPKRTPIRTPRESCRTLSE
eukprot:1137881-Pyramimonas_sp.AAC.1